MRNYYLEAHTALDIDKRVAKVLRDLGNPDPPLRLEIVREVLALDRAYYSSSDESVLQETIHKLTVGAKQIIRRPGLLVDVVRKLDLRALWLPDRKRILIDAELPPAKQRWGEGHEIGHSLIPWHQAVMLGDKDRTLSVTCHEALEGEANFAAGRLLFLRDAFIERLRDGSAITFNRLKALSREFGNTMTSTLWRAVEADDSSSFGLVSQHPRNWSRGKPLVRYLLRSRRFESQFAGVMAEEIFQLIGRFCFGRKGPIGSGEVMLCDVNGSDHVFVAEVFFNGHEALTLGVHQQQRSVVVAVP